MRFANQVAGAVLIVVLMAAPASGEWFTDVYLGGAVTQDSDVRVQTATGSSSQDVTYGSSVMPGVRVGRWLAATPWLGFAADVSYFGPQSDLQVIPISGLVMARVGLRKTDQFPDGVFRPYVAAGPGLFISHLDGDLGTARNVSDTSVDLGLDLRAGVAVHVQEGLELFQGLALFAEYRFTRVSPTFSVEIGGASRDVETTFNTHSIVIGASFRF